MAIPQLDALVVSSMVEPAHQHERLRNERRGAERLRVRGAGAKDRLFGAVRIPATVLCLRKISTHALLARIFGVTGRMLTRAVQEAWLLLDEHVIAPSTARFRTPTDVAAHLDAYGSRPRGRSNQHVDSLRALAPAADGLENRVQSAELG
ncbi:hypothetical protein [Streptomyces sp. NPDC048295]|uniref:hypothetical protein n=1 Tax=Streptomyces sp. NPDC048295 TaxID=3154617 RepID=UPI003435A740